MAAVERLSAFVLGIDIKDDPVEGEVLFACERERPFDEFVGDSRSPVFGIDVEFVHDGGVPDHRQSFRQHEDIPHGIAAVGCDGHAARIGGDTPFDPVEITPSIALGEFRLVSVGLSRRAGIGTESALKGGFERPQRIAVLVGIVGSVLHAGGYPPGRVIASVRPVGFRGVRLESADSISFCSDRAHGRVCYWDRNVTDPSPRAELAEKIAGEITLSEEPGATLRKWRTDFTVSQTELAEELAISSSVISDYESGRRESPGIAVVGRIVNALLDIDQRRGGDRIRQYARVLSAGFDSDIVHDLREYPAVVPLERFYESIGATELVAGEVGRVSGHTAIDSIEAITRLSSEEFYRLYGRSTNRALVFTGVTRGESPLVAMRVVNPTPNAVILHGLSEEELWDHAPDLARIDGFSLAVCDTDFERVLERLRAFP